MELNKKVSDLLFNTKNWFLARGIDQGDIDKQGLKLIEETGELVSGYLKGKHEIVMDSIGDVAVVVVGYAMMAGVNPEQVFYTRKEEYKPFNNVSTLIWMLVDNAFQAKASKDLGNEQGIAYSLSNIIFYLESICKELNYDFVSCFEYAYNEIKDRKGRWVNGSFVKEQDL